MSQERAKRSAHEAAEVDPEPVRSEPDKGKRDDYDEFLVELDRLIEEEDFVLPEEFVQKGGQ